MTTPTRTQLLIEARLGSSLPRFVAARRRAADSWETIARKLQDETSIPVTSQSLRNWFGDKHPGRVRRAAKNAA